MFTKFTALVSVGLMLCLATVFSAVSYAAKWKDVPQELLALQKNPYDPGSGALIVFDEGNMTLVYGSDSFWYEMERYRRVKVFTDEGKKYGSVRIWYQDRESVHAIKARVLLPDGRKLDMPSTDVLTEQLSETWTSIKFTIPGVTKGSILEYQYTKKSEWVGTLPAWHFDSGDYTLSSTFTATVPKEFQYTGNYVNMGNPPEMNQVKWVDGRGTSYTWSMKNRPAVKAEPYSLSWEKLRAGIQFVITGYYNGLETVPVYDNWGRVANFLRRANTSLGRRGAIPQVVKELTAGVTEPEEKIARIYDYVQRNIQRDNSSESLFPGKYAGAILASRKANSVQMSVLLGAMLDEVGFKPTLAWMATRDGEPFNAGFTSPVQFERMAVVVEPVPGKVVWLDPYLAGTPYGLLPWQDQGVPALKLTDSDLIMTPVTSYLNTETRSIRLTVTPEGHVTGKGTVSAGGQNARYMRRLLAFSNDEERRKSFHEELKTYLTNVELTLFEYKDQLTAVKPVETTFEFNSPDYATVAGTRLLINPTVYERISAEVLPATTRMNPIELGYATTETDEVLLIVPDGYVVEQLPAPITLKSNFGGFQAIYQNTPEGVRYKRTYAITHPFAGAEAYPELREFFARIAVADQQQIILTQK